MAKKQFLLYLDEDLINRLHELAQKNGRKSGQFVAMEILEQYADFWQDAEEARQAVIAQQREGLFETSGFYARGKGSKSEIEMVKKDAQSRAQKKRNG